MGVERGAKGTFYFLPASVGVDENDLTRLHMLLLLFLKASSARTDLTQVQRKKSAEVEQTLKV